MVKTLYQEDINTITVDIHDWVEQNFTQLTKEQEEDYYNLVDLLFEPFSHGYQNYN